MKYPNDLTGVKSLTSPKPDYLLGITLDMVDDVLDKTYVEVDQDSTSVVFPVQYVHRLFNKFQEWQTFTGGVGQNFGLPQFVLERKSLSGGSLFSCQNQLVGGLRCVVAAMALVESKLSVGAPVIAYGMANVGNYIELWSMTMLDGVRIPASLYI